MYRDAALQFLTVQVTTLDVLDAKTIQAFSIGSTVLPLTVALLNLSGKHVPDAASWALGIALVSYVVLLPLAARASFIRGLEYRPDIATLRKYADPAAKGALDGRSLQLWIGNEYLASIEENKRILWKKARWVGGCIAMLFVESVCLAAAALATVLL